MYKLNKLVSDVSAFNTWDELTASLNAGYVPTIRSDYGSRSFKSKCTRLRNLLRRAGFKVYDGVTVR